MPTIGGLFLSRLDTNLVVSLIERKDIATVDGRNPANQLRLVVYPTIYMILYIPG